MNGATLAECLGCTPMGLVDCFLLKLVIEDRLLFIPQILTLRKLIPTQVIQTLMFVLSWYALAPPSPSSLSHLIQVGEAPVQLREDQYDKLRRWNCLCDIYVNHLGDVCIRKFERDPPHGGTVFAQTSWSRVQPQDKQGYPIFQNTRGVCAKIVAPPLPVTPNSTISKFYHQTSQTLRSLFLKRRSSSEGGGEAAAAGTKTGVETGGAPAAATGGGATGGATEELTELMGKRQELYGDLTKIERKYKMFQELRQQAEKNQLAIQQNLQLIELYSSHCQPSAPETAPGTEATTVISGPASSSPSPPQDETFHVTYDHYRQSIEDLKKANAEMRELEQSLQEKLRCSEVVLDEETYLVEKERIKKELEVMKIWIKDYVKKNKHLFP
jgi:hypothetical protein